MGRVTGSLERPIQGVSQQTDKDRIDGQCTLQENMIPKPISGLIKRIGTRHINGLGVSAHPGDTWYHYSRGDGEEYFMLFRQGDYPRVWDETGSPRVVNIESGHDYSYVTDASDLSISTVADTTFIANKGVVVQHKGDEAQGNPAMAIVYLQYATYGRDYQVLVDGDLVATYTTPDGANAETDPPFIKTNYIAEILAQQMNGQLLVTENLTSSPGIGGSTPEIDLSQPALSIGKVVDLTSDEIVNNYSWSESNPDLILVPGRGNHDFEVQYFIPATTGLTAEAFGNTIFVTRDNGQRFSINTVDSADGRDLIAIQDRVKQLSNLPPVAPNGYVIEVQEQEGFKANSYWLKAEPSLDNSTGSEVRWVETVEPGSVQSLDEETMPYSLVSLADGSFTLSPIDWTKRSSGGDKANPLPSFVGNKVTSLGVFQNRMLITSGESVTFGRSDDFYGFFRETVQAASDTDPVEAFADTAKVNNLLHNAVLDGDVVFFAENGQFIIDGSQPLTKDKVVFRQATSFPMNANCAPAVTGESIMFAFNAGTYTGVRELFTDSFTDTKRARPITDHITEYIEGPAREIASSPNINTVAIQATSGDTLYMYDWLWQGDQKVQSAFHKWIFGGTVEFVRFVNDRLYLVMSRNGSVYLEVIPISSDEDDKGLDFPVRLDRRTDIQSTWDGEKWLINLPYPTDMDVFTLIRGEDCYEEDRGTSVIIEDDGQGNYFTYDDLAPGTLCWLIAGETYTSKFTPTKPFLRDQNGRVIGLDRLTIGKFHFNYESIGNTRATVSDRQSRRQWQYNYNGRMFGGWNNRVGFAPLDFGVFTVPVRLVSGNASILLETDDYRPFTLRDMEWEGMFKQRGRRL